MDLRRFFYRFWPIIVGLSIFVYFAYHGFSGERGVLKYWTIQNELDEKEFELLELQTQRQKLEEKIKRLNPKSIDLDFLEEQAMKVLNFFHKDHIVVIKKTLDDDIVDKE
ncbi:MAG: septum formation initiator family protein [Alphaproteobacteria bacterium]|nr:septum formation initiator family protein [Alphaproteobacteria bacterium]